VCLSQNFKLKDYVRKKRTTFYRYLAANDAAVYEYTINANEIDDVSE